MRSVTIRSVFGSHAAVPIPEAPRESLVVSGVSGLGLVQVYTLISPGRSGCCLPTCTNRRNLVAPLAGYELIRPYICRLTMSGLKTREWVRYQLRLRTSTEPDSPPFNRNRALLWSRGQGARLQSRRSRVRIPKSVRIGGSVGRFPLKTNSHHRLPSNKYARGRLPL